MKRVIVLLFGSLLLIVGVAGCGSSDGSGGTTSTTARPGY
jgi:hypothetical protein